MRKLLVFFSVLAMVFAGAPVAGAQQQSRFPSPIELPDGFFPEGIARGRGTTAYVGSLADGSIWKGNVRTGEGEVFTEPTGPFSTVGLDVDHRNRVWVAGGPTGIGRVYNGRTGELLATYDFTGPQESFINDVIVTRHAAYFTDSGTEMPSAPGQMSFAGKPRLFKVPLGRAGRLPASGASSVDVIDLDVPDLGFPNLNGIETLPRRTGLVVAHTNAGALFQVDPATGDASRVDIGRDLIGADGLTRRGRSLFVVENAASQITHVRVNPRTGRARVRDVLPVPDAETPTTAALFGPAIYTVDARFQSGVGPYFIYRIRI